MRSTNIWTAAASLALLTATSALGADNKQGDLNVFLKGGVGEYTGSLGDHASAGHHFTVEAGRERGYRAHRDCG